MMRGLLPFLVLSVLASAAFAQTPEERDYLAARDAAIATVRAHEKEADYGYDGVKYRQFIGDLEKRLRRAIGAITPPKGFAGTGKLSPDILCCGLGEGELDGIAFAKDNDRVIVTTEGLLRAWLSQHRNWWKNEPPMPNDPRIAFGSDAFCTQAIGTDAHVDVFAPLPIALPAGTKIAVAQLVLQSQAGALWPPKDIAIGVIKGGRVYAALAEATTKPRPIAACDAVLKDFQRRLDAAFAAHKADDAIQLETTRDAAFIKCWGERVRDEPAYPAVVRQAQALVNALAGE